MDLNSQESESGQIDQVDESFIRLERFRGQL